MYFPAEESESRTYVFDKIVASDAKSIDDVDKNTKYQIQIDNRRYIVFCHQLRNESNEFSESEKKYWFESSLKNYQFTHFIVRK